jgi:hypothetical protein
MTLFIIGPDGVGRNYKLILENLWLLGRRKKIPLSFMGSGIFETRIQPSKKQPDHCSAT